jgi:protein-S-isoprenylcysteine O-methyltransferase Ste14
MSTEELLFRRLVVSASGLIYWGGVLIQGRRVRKQIGRSPNLKPRGAREKALWFGWFLVILAWIVHPWLVQRPPGPAGITLIAALVHPIGLALGLALVVLGYAATLWAYQAMGNTWRIGIDAREKTSLISRGPYRWVRHPIYSLQMVMLTGAALLLPTPIAFGAVALHLFCVRIKARDEEQYLLGVHGESYRDYLSRTGGLLPKFR